MSALSKLKKWATSNKGRLEVVGGVGVFVLFELYKEQILQHSYLAGGASVYLALVLACYYQFDYEEKSYGWQVLFTYIATMSLIFVALFGWFVCQEKKDQLNMKRALAQLRTTLYAWTDAQQRLEGAIVGIKMNDKKVEEIQSEISSTLGDIEKDLQRLTQQQGADIMDRLRDMVSKLVTNCNNVADDVLDADADAGGESKASDGRHMTDVGVDAFRGLLVHMLDPSGTARFLDLLTVKGVDSFRAELRSADADANRVLGADLNAYLKQQAALAATDRNAVTSGGIVNELVKKQVALVIMLGAEAVAEREATDVALVADAARVIRDVQDAINLRILTYRKFADRIARLQTSTTSVLDTTAPSDDTLQPDDQASAPDASSLV